MPAPRPGMVPLQYPSSRLPDSRAKGAVIDPIHAEHILLGKGQFGQAVFHRGRLYSIRTLQVHGYLDRLIGGRLGGQGIDIQNAYSSVL